MARQRTRANNDADVYPRRNKEGKITGYRGPYWITDPATGGRKRRYVSGKTKEETRRKLTRARNGLLEPAPTTTATGETVSEYMTRWLENHYAKGSRTYLSYASQIRLHISPAIGGLPLTQVKRVDVEDVYGEMKRKGLSHSTITHVRAVLRRALEDAVDLEILETNPAAKVKLPRDDRNGGDDEEMTVFSPGEAKRFLEAVAGDEYEALYVLSLECGLRIGEALGLKWDDVNWQHRTLRIERQLQRDRDGGGLIFQRPKRGSRRTITLPQRTLRALVAHRKRQLEAGVGSTVKEWRGLVFTTATGSPLEASNFTSRRFKPLLREAGLPEIRWHDLRHTCATLLIADGQQPSFVQHLLGHKSIMVTLDRYSHYMPEMGDSTAAAMDAILG